MSLFRADHLSRGFLPSVVLLSERVLEVPIMRRIWPPRGCCVMTVEKYGGCIQKFALLERMAKLHSAFIREI